MSHRTGKNTNSQFPRRLATRWLFSIALCWTALSVPLYVAARAAAQDIPPAVGGGHDAALAETAGGGEPAKTGGAGPSIGAMLNVFRAGGPMLIPLALCSFLLCVFTFERAISLRRGRVIPRPFVKRFLHQLEEEQLDCREALKLCRENSSPVATVFEAAVIKWDRPAVEVEQAVIDSGERVANTLRRYLRLFNGISTISPLMGLLGTVLGMIRAFNMIATTDAMGRPDLLASGISQALITTAAGLTVAIPALVAYLVFSSRVDRLVMEIDALSQQVVNFVASDGYKERKPTKRRAKAAA